MPTLSRKKKLTILLVVLLAIGSISVYYIKSYYQEKEQATLSKARTDMIIAQATAKNIKLLSDSEIKNVTAVNTGVPLEQLTFKEVSLITFDDLPHDPPPNNRYGDRDETNQPSSGNKTPRPASNSESPGSTPTDAPPVEGSNSAVVAEKPQIPNYSRTHPNELRKHPLYRIIATSKGVVYDLLIDAVNGQILRSTVR